MAKNFSGFEIINWKNPDKDWNEDVVGHIGNTFWVIDGTGSSSDENIYPDFRTAPEGFAYRLSQGLEIYAADESRNLVNILADALQFCRDRSLMGNRMISNSDLPAASLVAIRIDENSIAEYLRLGDCEIYYPPANLLIDDKAHKKMDADVLAGPIRARMQELGVDKLQPEDFVDIIREKRELLMNTEGNWWVAVPDAQMAYRSEVGVIPIRPETSLYLWSDGFGNMFENYGAPLALLEREPVEIIADAIRKLEEKDESCRQFPRLRTYDDLSVIRIYL